MRRERSVSSQHAAKQAAASSALSLVLPGMLLGVGSGSTVACFIDALGASWQKNPFPLQIFAGSTSSEKRARAWALPLADGALLHVDLTVDGADQIDAQRRMIKGGGGALLQEKLLFGCSRRIAIIVDASKCVNALGLCSLPVEVVPFACATTVQRIQELGYNGSLRMREGAPFVSDAGHYIFDLDLNHTIDDPRALHDQLKSTLGVVETGLFFNTVDHLIVGEQLPIENL